MTDNIFQIHEVIGKIPFAASRRNWSDDELIVITKVMPKGNYGKAYGFSVRNGIPNDHVAYSSWKKDMELPNVGSFQWRLIDLSDEELQNLITKFYNGIAKKYNFVEPIK